MVDWLTLGQEVMGSNLTCCNDVVSNSKALNRHCLGLLALAARKISVSEHAFSSVICRDDAR